MSQIRSLTNTNPYQPPKAGTAPPPVVAGRHAALRHFRIALLILLVPAFYNFVCFNFLAGPATATLALSDFHRLVNTLGFAFGTVALWYFGLAMLEVLSVSIHAIFARESELVRWKSDLYDTLRRGPLLACLGAVLWSIWVAGFYQLGISFYVISVPIGVAAHIVAACLYLPLIYRWYQTKRATPNRTSA